MPAKKKSAPEPAAENAHADAPGDAGPEVREVPPNGAASPNGVAQGARTGAESPPATDGATASGADAAAAAYAALPESTRQILETQFRARVLGLRELPVGRMR